MVAEEFQRLVYSFPSSPFGVSRVIRKLQEDDPDEFRRHAYELLREETETPGGKYVATLLSIRTEAVPCGELADPATMELATAIRVARAVQANDAQFEQRMLDYLVEGKLPLDKQSRILDVLDAIASGPRILTAFRRIAKTAEPALVSKFALVAAKKDPNREWFEARLAEPDARIRGNVVEALWGHIDPKSLNVLRAAVHDSSARVVANGVVGLYLAGDPASISALHELLISNEERRRKSGVWAAGHLRDPRFEYKLRELGTGADGQMRRLVKDALTKIEERRAERPLDLSVKIVSVQRDSVGRFLVPFTVLNAEEQPVGGAASLEFQIYQDGQPVLRYAVSENTPGSGAYFLTASPVVAGSAAEERMVQITIGLSCERGRGEQSTFWFRS